MARYVFVTGGVVSSLGKGVATATLGALLQARGYRVRLRKLDPYLNVDPGTMSPLQHGEVFVTEDGAETDLDLGHYERFTDVSSCRSDNVTTGRIYKTILEKERRGDFLGATIQIIPHVTDAIKDFITYDSDLVDFMLCEIGGTVGDIESQPFLEAIRQLGNELGRDRVVFVHMTLLPYISKAGELKTKPTQHSVRELQSLGIQPTILMCRSERSLRQNERDKISSLCNVQPGSVIEAPDLDHIYQAPLAYHDQGLDTEVMRHFGETNAPSPDLSRWRTVSRRLQEPQGGGGLRVALVGKYMDVPDAYKSLSEALQHGALAQEVGIEIVQIPAEALDDTEKSVVETLGEVSGIVVPGGFGVRGSVGKMRCSGFARQQNIPFLGICFGMQMAVIEAARQMAGIAGAHSTEIDPDTEDPVVGLMQEWQRGDTRIRRDGDVDLGGSMRLGSYPARLSSGTLAASIYGTESVSERHRHRYEINPAYIGPLERAGMRFSGMSPDGSLPEIVEIPDHPWFIGVQFHPELKSRPFDPHPLFASFIGASMARGRLL